MALHIDIKDHEFYVEGELKGDLKRALISAEKMILKGYNIVEIQDITGLTFEQIKALQADLEKSK